MAASSAGSDKRGEVLVAIMHDPRDFAILKEQLWYRVPVESAPKRWPPEWLAFYQTKIFDEEAYSIRYYGHVREIKRVNRQDLFPSETQNSKTSKEYYQIFLDRIEKLSQPIISQRWRRIVFIATTWNKFSQAVEINDLFDDSSLEDELWIQLKRHRIRAERQWLVSVGNVNYFLDFAIFCKSGNIDVEADGDSYHLGNRARAQADNRRNNTLTRIGWSVLRYTSHQIREEASTYCIPEIRDKIDRLDGLLDDEHIPHEPIALPEDEVLQLTVFGEAIKPRHRKRR